MTIYTRPPQRRFLDLLPDEVPTSAVLGAATEEALITNPVGALGRMGELTRAEQGTITIEGQYPGEFTSTYEPPASKRLSREETEQRIKDAGFDISVPDEGMREETLSILMRRHQEQKERQLILSRATPWQQAGAFGAGLATSLIDPINIASAFIPVVGPARYTRMLERAAGPLERALIRAKVGVAEGAIGAAAVEPLPLMASLQDETDYGLADSLLNIAFGSILGGGLHTVGEFFHIPTRTDDIPAALLRRQEIPESPLPTLTRSVDARLDRPDVRRTLVSIRDELPVDTGTRLDARQDDIVAAIRKVGGADRDELIAEGFDPADFQSLPPGTVRAEGRKLDDLRETLAQEGYPSSMDEFVTAIQETLSGQPVYSAARIPGAPELERVSARPSEVRRAIDRALRGERLGSQQRQIIADILDDMEGLKPTAFERVREAPHAQREDALRGAVAQAATGKPIDVESVFEGAEYRPPKVEQSADSLRVDEELKPITELDEIEAVIEEEMELRRLAGREDIPGLDDSIEDAEAYSQAMEAAAVCLRSA